MLYWRAPNTEAGENTAYIMCELAGPNTEKLEHQFQQAMQVGGANTENGTPISTGNTSWGETEINFAKISFLSYSLYHFCSNP